MSSSDRSSESASDPSGLPYRCVCGQIITLHRQRGGKCSHCDRNYLSDVLDTLGAETTTFSPAHGIHEAKPAVDAKSDPNVGKSFGHFRIVKRLGQGGMGNVYLALDESLERYVALKTIDTSGQTEAEQVQLELLFREAIAQARVNHPHVVHIYFVGRDPKEPFLAMELVSGPTLANVLEKGPLPFGQIIQVALQIGAALDHAGRFDIVHGDIKPSNILLADDQTAKLSDFGLARRLSSVETGGEVLSGSPNYISPEAVEGKSTDIRSDMYSLGVMLFEMTFGRLPYPLTGKNVIDRLEAHRHAQVEFPEAWPARIPQWWRDVLARLLAKNPTDRYESYQQLIEQLERIRPITLPRAGRFLRGVAWAVDLVLVAITVNLLAQLIPLPVILGRLADPGLLIAVATLAVAMQTVWRTTPGKKLFQIRIVDRHGLTPSAARLALRGVVQFLPFFWFGLSQALMLMYLPGIEVFLTAQTLAFFVADLGFAVFHPRGVTVHDMLFDTFVGLDVSRTRENDN